MRRCRVCRAVYAPPLERCPRDGASLVEASEDAFVGSVFGAYRALDLVGKGAMAQVYRAEHVSQRTRHALKLLVGPNAEEDGVRERFPREAAAIRGIAHPNVVTLADFGVSGDVLYLVMEWVDGGALSEAIKREAPFDPQRVAEIARGIAAGLGAIHRHGFIHRDLKPQNVLLDLGGGRERPKIVDFGLVASADWTRLTESGCLVGTPLYMAPEIIEGRGAEARSDLYSLGVMIYEMLTGKPPFTGATIHDILTGHLSRSPVPLFGSGGLEALALALLEKRVDDRPADAASVEQILSALLRSTTDDFDSATTLDTQLPDELKTPITLPRSDELMTVSDATENRAPAFVETATLRSEPSFDTRDTTAIDAPRRRPSMAVLIVGAIVVTLVVTIVIWSIVGIWKWRL